MIEQYNRDKAVSLTAYKLFIKVCIRQIGLLEEIWMDWVHATKNRDSSSTILSFKRGDSALVPGMIESMCFSMKKQKTILTE